MSKYKMTIICDECKKSYYYVSENGFKWEGEHICKHDDTAKHTELTIPISVGGIINDMLNR